jgi:hypothetical protein
MSCQDVVFIVPGFLGFERTGNFSHFADRVCSALRTHMEGKLERRVAVLPLASLPTTSFAERQRALIEAIAREVRALGGVERIHLLGHSVGGVDGHLLGCARSLDGAGWQVLDPHGVRSRVKTLVSLATPHQGTCLAAAPGAGSLTLGALWNDSKGALAMLQLVQKLLASALRDVGSDDRRQGLLRETRKVRHFMAELMRWQGFFHALTPEAMADLYAAVEPLPGFARRSFVSMAGRPLVLVDSEQRGADAFFQELSRRTSGVGNGFTRHEPTVRASVMRLRDVLAGAPGEHASIIVSEHARAPLHVDGQTNDGVVNSARQLVDPNDAQELCGLVIADHFDVLGYYDRSAGVERGTLPTTDALSGLLHSGSCFRDTEFLALYRRIGDAILPQCAGRAQTEWAVPAAEQLAARKPLRRSPSRRPIA